MMPIMHEFIWIHFESIYNVPWHLSIIRSTCVQPSVINTISFPLSLPCTPPTLRGSPSLNLVVKHFVPDLVCGLCYFCSDKMPCRSHSMEEGYSMACDPRGSQSVMAGKASKGGPLVVGASGRDSHMADRPGSRKREDSARDNMPFKPWPSDSLLQAGPHFLKVPRPIKRV